MKHIKPVDLQITLPSGHVEAMRLADAKAIYEQLGYHLLQHTPHQEAFPLLKLACDICHVFPQDVLGGSRTDHAALARWLMWEQERTHATPYEAIGNRWGYDHGTVMNGLRRLKELERQPHTWQAEAIKRWREALAHAVSNGLGVSADGNAARRVASAAVISQEAA